MHEISIDAAREPAADGGTQDGRARVPDALHPQRPLDIVNPAVLARCSELAERYRAGSPFPHIVIDDFFTEPVIQAIAAGFPRMEQMPKLFREPMSYKGQLSDIDRRWPTFSELFAALQSEEFRQLLSEISGVDALLADPMLAGGGLHQSPNSGFLDIHVDANFHPMDKTKHRRLNILLYATPDWDPSWGGDLQLWSDKNKSPDRVAATIQPKFNRVVLFSTTRTSWHGVAPIRCPPDKTRRSVALYYYTAQRPEHERYLDSSVIWFSKSPLKKLLYPAMNAAIAVLKPYAKRLRKLRGDNTFDAGNP